MNLKGSPYAHASAPRKEHGAIMLDGRQVASTEQCPHCTAHFVSERGSGKRRMICQQCGGRKTCGHPLCDLHVPFQEALDFSERRRVQEKYAGIIKQDGHLLLGTAASATGHTAPSPGSSPAGR